MLLIDGPAGNRRALLQACQGGDDLRRSAMHHRTLTLHGAITTVCTPIVLTGARE